MNKLIKTIVAAVTVTVMLGELGMAVYAEWDEDEHGQWQYVDENGDYLTGWHDDVPGYEGKWFYFDDEGYMCKGWLEYDGNWYYLHDDGAMVTGWFKDSDGKWYYFGEDGALVEENSGSIFNPSWLPFAIAAPIIAAAAAVTVITLKKRKQKASI